MHTKVDELKMLQDELKVDIMKLSRDDLWKVHKAVNDIKYAANLTRYAQRGLPLKRGATYG